MDKKREKQTLHVINLTHWDREWLLPFELYRMKLVEYNDMLLELMDKDPDFKHYHFDGQVLCLEDYLDLRPEKRQIISTLVEQGKIFIGPWYTLPDMNLVNGETIIRNLLTGIKVSRSLGKPMLEGYTPCSDGQISQLPQIYMGFGINSAIIYKGLSHFRMPKEFLWESPDGTSIFTIQLADRRGRCNFYDLLYMEVICNVIHDTADNNWEYELKEDRLPFRVDGDRSHNPYRYINLEDNEGFHKEHLIPYLDKLRRQASEGSASSHFLGFNGMDHTPPFPVTSKLVSEANRCFPDLNVIDSSLPEAIAQIRKDVAKELKIHKGEFRDTKKTESDRNLYAPTLSFRMDIKTTNREIEHLLVDVAEPFDVWARIKGADYPDCFLTHAWKLLLANHGHDSICGCNIDTVNEDVLNRYKNCKIVCQTIIEQSLGYLLKNADSTEKDCQDIPQPHVVVFNPSVYTRNGLCRMYVDLKNKFKDNCICLVDQNGKRIRAQSSFVNESDIETNGLVKRPMQVYRHKLLFRADDIPAMDYRSFRVDHSLDGNRVSSENISSEKNIMENKHLKVTIREDGRMDILNKATGKLYPGLHYFADEGEAGDPWTNTPVPGTKKTNLDQPADIKLMENGFLGAAYKLKIKMPLPDLTLTSIVSLDYDSKRVDIKTVVENSRKDHKLTACFPTGLKSKKTYAGGQYDVLERSTELPDMSDWKEKIHSYPNYGFLGISDQRDGLSILNIGLSEYFIDRNKKDSLTLTLMRSTQLKQWPEDKSHSRVKGGQCLGVSVFRYAICPHRGDWRDGMLWQEYRDFACPLVTAQYFGSYRNNSTGSLISLKPDTLECSCIKKAEESNELIMRIWNPLDIEQKGMIKAANSFKDVSYVDFNEVPFGNERISLKQIDNNTVEFNIKKKGIITLLLRWPNENKRQADEA